VEALYTAGETGVPDLSIDPNIAVYVEHRATEKWEERLFEQYPPEKLARYADVSRDPAGFILCVSYYDFHELLDILPDGGTYIYSSSEAFNEEMHIDLERLRSWVNHFGLKLVGDPGARGGSGKDPGFHSSGHIHGPGIVEMVETIKPRYLIPVHTEDRSWFERKFRDKVDLVIPKAGESVSLP